MGSYTNKGSSFTTLMWGLINEHKIFYIWVIPYWQILNMLTLFSLIISDPKIMKKSGKIIHTTTLAREFGFTDINGEHHLNPFTIKYSLVMSRPLLARSDDTRICQDTQLDGSSSIPSFLLTNYPWFLLVKINHLTLPEARTDTYETKQTKQTKQFPSNCWNCEEKRFFIIFWFFLWSSCFIKCGFLLRKEI